MGTQKNRLNETVLLGTQSICENWWVRKYFAPMKLNPYTNEIATYAQLKGVTLLMNTCICDKYVISRAGSYVKHHLVYTKGTLF